MNNKTKTILNELGIRIKQARINSHITQEQLADIIGMSVRAIKYAEKGQCKLSTFVSIIVALKLDSTIDLFVPEQQVSPLLLAKSKKLRLRASPKSNDSKNSEDLGW